METNLDRSTPERSFLMEVAERHPESYEHEHAYEPFTTALWRRLSCMADIVIDIGAHWGWYSINAALANPKSRVIALEGGPDTAEVCRRNCESTVPGRVEVHSALFGSSAGHTEFSGVRRPTISGPDLGVEGGCSLLVKVDVEGHEVDALTGLAGLAAASTSIRMIVALNPKSLDRAGSSPHALLGWLRDQGFKTYLLDDRTRRWSFVPDDRDPGSIVSPNSRGNLYCVRGTEVVGTAFVLHSSALGGAELSTISTARTLGLQGSLVHCYLPDWNGGLVSRLEAVGATVSRYPGRWWAGQGDELDLAQSCYGIERLLADVHTHPVEAVVSVTGVTPIGAVMSQLSGLPHVWSLHEYLDDDHGLALPASLAEIGDFITEHSDFIVANSESVAQHVLGRGADRIIPPFDALEAADVRFVAPREGTPRVLGCFSALHPGKGIAQLLTAVSLVVADGRDVVLSLYGLGSAGRQATYESAADALGIRHRVQFHGRVDDPSAAMAAVDVVVMPSLREAFGRVPMEAILVGRPVVYTRGGGMDDYMVDGVTGVACDPGDAADLARAISRLVDDARLRADLANRARPAIEGWLEQHDRGSTWQSLLVDVVASKGPSAWPDRARAEMNRGAATAAVAREQHVSDELDRTGGELTRLAREFEGMAQDRQIWHDCADSWRERAEALEGELAARRAEWQLTNVELDRIRGTLRYQTLFGWGARVGLKNRTG